MVRDTRGAANPTLRGALPSRAYNSFAAQYRIVCGHLQLQRLAATTLENTLVDVYRARFFSRFWVNPPGSPLTPGCIMSATPVSLCKAWDNIEMNRTCVREHGRMLLVVESDGRPQVLPREAPIPKTVANARINKFMIRPVFEIMHQANSKLPTIDFMIAAVQAYYDENKLDGNASAVYQEAWGVRRLCQLVKSRIYKPTPPKDPASCFLVFISITVSYRSPLESSKIRVIRVYMLAT